MSVDTPVAPVATIEPLAPPPLPSPRRRWPTMTSGRIVTLSTVGLTVHMVLGRIAQASAAALLHQPLLLLLLSASGPFAGHASKHVAWWLYLSVGLLRSTLPNVSRYMLGRHGRHLIARPRPPSRFRLVRWGRAKMVAAKRRVRWWIRWADRPARWLKSMLEAHFPRWGYLFVALRPNTFMMVSAGVFGLRPAATLIASSFGNLMWLIMLGFLAQHIPWWILAIPIF